MKKCAFTLAEVLITLGIIGVVASLTLPSIIQRKIEKTTIVKLQKFTSTFENAFNMAIAEYGPVSQWFEGDVSQAGDCHEVWDKVIPYMPPIVKDCTGKRGSKCFASTYYDRNGNQTYNSNEWSTGCKAIFSDGTAVILQHIPWRYGLFQNLGTAYGGFGVDLNGPTGPNKLGLRKLRHRLMVLLLGLCITVIWTICDALINCLGVVHILAKRRKRKIKCIY